MTIPEGVQTSLSYSTSPEAVCTVDATSGALTIVGVGSCEITVTAVASDDYNEATASFTVAVQALGTLVLNVDAITGDDTINIAEKANGFSITGNTGSEVDVEVTVTIGETELTSTSADNNGSAEWTVSVPADASYITESSIDVLVDATKTGYTAADEESVPLIVDLSAPTAPTYTAPTSLQVDEEISDVAPTGGSDIDTYSASGLPDGLSIDASSGVISGTPTTVSTTDATVTVTVTDSAGNTATVDVTFPAVADIDRGVTIAPTELNIPEGGSATYTVVLISEPTGTVTITPSVSGSSDVTLDTSVMNFTTEDWDELQTVTVQTVHDAFTGDDEATVSHAVSGADYSAVTADDVAVTVIDDELESTEIQLSVDPSVVNEADGSTTITVTATLNEAPRTAATPLTVSIGASNDSATASSDYAPVEAFTITIASGSTAGVAEFVLTPTDDDVPEDDEQISVTGATDIEGLSVVGTTITISEFVNTAPMFNDGLTATLSIAENTTEGESIGSPYVATDADDHTLTYGLSGVDASRFAINEATGQLRTSANLDHEAKPRHSLHVTASDGYGGETDYALVINVTDVDEQASTPPAPTVTASPGTTTSLSVRWARPDTNGGPNITGYGIQYRESKSTTWHSHRHIGNVTRATITGLTVATDYQVRVRALNGETPSGWSAPGEGHTARASNTAPEFDAGLTTTLTVAENTVADTALGTVFTATDADEDTLAYTLVGTDRRSFAIDAATGQLRTLAALDHEAKSMYSLSVRADDGNGGVDDIAVTINISDIEEQVGTIEMPVVLARQASTTSIDVSWREPDANGGPQIHGYELQYRERTESNDDAENSAESTWIDHQHRSTGTRTVIAYLDVDTAFEVRVRALNGEITGEWSAPGEGRTAVPINRPPAFNSELPSLVRVEENATVGVNVGEPFVASDRDDHTLTYLLQGTSRRHFAIDAASGQVTTRIALDYESRSRYTLRLRADDGHGGTDTLTLDVVVVDVLEQAPSLSAPSVLATANSTSSLDIDWRPPDRNGGPAVLGYEVQYRIGSDVDWVNYEQEDTTGTHVTVDDLVSDSQYQARVRALNGEIPGDWSEPGSGRTGRTVNDAPAFTSNVFTSLTVRENTSADTDIGEWLTATDANGDILTFSVVGSNRHAFAIDSDSGQLRTLAALDHETTASYVLTIQVSDGVGGADTVDVTIVVADVDERAAQPDAPLVLATADSTTGLALRWHAPDANGGPSVERYDVQYRASTDEAWTDIVHEGVETRAMLSGLETATVYEVRVRAINGETPSLWSALGVGTTGRNGNAAPQFSYATVTRSVAEDSLVGEPIGTVVVATDPDQDSLTYTLNGEDASSFTIDPQTGQIRTGVLLDYETQSAHTAIVSAWDGNGGVATVDVTIEVIDAQEAASQFGPAVPIGVRLGRTLSLDATNTVQSEISLRWESGDQDETQEASWFEYRLGRYPESSNGMDGPAFQCASNRPFETDGWHRIPDSGSSGINRHSYRFSAQAIGCYVLRDTFELRAQVRAVVENSDGTSSSHSAPSTEARMQDEAPRVVGLWLANTDLATLGVGDDLTFIVAFTEPVRVQATSISPSLEFSLGTTTRQASFVDTARPPVFRNYGSGTIGSELQFTYEIQTGDDSTVGIAVPANAIGIAESASILDATGPSGHAADLTHAAKTLSEGTTVVATTSEETVKAEFETSSVPGVHDGETTFSVQVNFNKDQNDESLTASDVSGVALSATSLLVTGGTLRTIARVEQGDDSRWAINVDPNSNADVSISLGPTIDCDDEGAVCTTSGRRLSNNIHAVIKGPPGFHVADAQVAEGTNATMDFNVTLSRPLVVSVSVTYATADGTATAGEDYEATSGTLTFEAGVTAMLVSVSVFDDAHDDDGETFTLTLSNPTGSNAYLIQPTATGTIKNADPMPKAWIVRFGRTVSSHVIEAIQTRLYRQDRQNHLTLGGYGIGGLFDRTVELPQTSSELESVGSLLAPAWTSASDSFIGDNNAFFANTVCNNNGNPQTSEICGASIPNHATSPAFGSGYALISLADILKRSSFFYGSDDIEREQDAPDSEGFKGWSTWGSTATTRFNGHDDSLRIEGEVFTAFLGIDARWNQWLTGVVLAHSDGQGTFTHETANGGSTTSTLTTLNPYVQYRFSDRTSVWGTIGVGEGDLALTTTGTSASVETDLEMMLAAFGGRGILSTHGAKTGHFELALRSDTMVSRTTSGASVNLQSAAGSASRVRVMLEGAGTWTFASKGVLMPTIEAGLRYDDGDAETGAGLEVGAGLAFSTGRIKLGASARGLVVHEAHLYDEWGFTSTVAYSPDQHGRGVDLRIGSVWGATQSQTRTLWDRETTIGLTTLGSMRLSQRFHAELGYGLTRQRSRTLLRPFVGLESKPRGATTWRTGFKYTTDHPSELGLHLRSQTGKDGAARIGLELRGRILW